MEYCSSTLADQMKLRKRFGRNYDELEIVHIMLDVLKTLYQLHSLNFAHMDVKPGNL